MSLLHRMRLWDKVTGYFASINASGEQLVKDTDSLTQLGDIETAIDETTDVVELNTVAVDLVTDAVRDVEENQTDKTQMTNITDGTLEADIVANEDDTTDLDDKNGLVTSSVLYNRISNTDIRPLRADASTHSIQQVSYEHHEIHSGSHYMLCSYVDLALNNVYDIQITTPNTTKWSHFTFKLDVQSETLWEIYENVTINTAGTDENVRNNNRNSANTSGMVVKGILNSSTANANSDTATAGADLLEDGLAGAGKNSGGSDERNKEIVLKQNEDYTLRVTANAAGYVDYCLQWYEHTNKD